jgi:WD40 repeat protein
MAGTPIIVPGGGSIKEIVRPAAPVRGSEPYWWWNQSGETPVRALQGHSKDVRAVTFLGDGRVVSGGSDKTVRAWNPAAGECLTTIKAKGPVYAVAAAPDGSFAYAGRAAPRDESNFVYLCDTAGKPAGRCELRTQEEVIEFVLGRWEAVRTMRWAPRSIWSLAFSADGKYLAAAYRVPGGANIPYGGGGRCWARDPKGDDVDLPAKAYALAFAPDGHRLAVTRQALVSFHADPTPDDGVSYKLTSDWSAAVALVPGAELAVVGSNSFLDFLNPCRWQKPTRLKTGLRTVLAVAVSPDGKMVLAAGKPGAVELYDVAARTRTATYDFGIGGVHALAFAPDGLTFAAGGDKGLVVCDVSG